jgi:putative cell wall-binding protein
MNKLKSALVLVLIGALLLSAGVPTFAEGRRLYGDTREYTATAVSRDGWPYGSKSVVVANGYSFADAIAAGPLAKLLDAPILLTRSDALPDATRLELSRLHPENIYIIGGNAVVSYGVENALAAYVDSADKVVRVAGRDRYETAAAIAQNIRESGGSTDEVILVRGDDYADALTAAAVVDVVPILFANKAGEASLHIATARSLASLEVKRVVVAGGEAAVSDQAVGQAYSIIGSHNPYPVRVSGKTRYDTAIAMADFFKPESGYQGVVLATGNDFADALVGGPYAAKKVYAMVLVNNRADRPLPDVAEAFIQQNTSIPSDAVIALGGPRVLPESALEDAIDAAENREFDVDDWY